MWSPGEGIWLTYYGDPRVGELTFETLKRSNFPWVAPTPTPNPGANQRNKHWSENVWHKSGLIRFAKSHSDWQYALEHSIYGSHHVRAREACSNSSLKQIRGRLRIDAWSVAVIYEIVVCRLNGSAFLILCKAVYQVFIRPKRTVINCCMSHGCTRVIFSSLW